MLNIYLMLINDYKVKRSSFQGTQVGGSIYIFPLGVHVYSRGGNNTRILYIIIKSVAKEEHILRLRIILEKRQFAKLEMVFSLIEKYIYLQVS